MGGWYPSQKKGKTSPADPAIAWASLAPQHYGARTVLSGLLDRSAVYGVLAEIEALGLDLLEIQRLTPDRKSPEPGDRRSP
jgi:hypothetical protein